MEGSIKFDKYGQFYTVSKLTAEIKNLLEEKFPFVWIAGEISNFRVPVSGHFYFVLKDENAQIQAVMFRGQNQGLKFEPEDGLSITGLGRISVYEPRGTYQIIFEYLEPKGVGALQIAFEQLKTRLSADGLFNEQHKKPIPFLPKKIGIVTSPTGAVVHDMLNILNRRFSSIPVDIFPVKVQGDGAEKEIEFALDSLNAVDHTDVVDVVIVARGGGSLEDLQAFNSETVARAIFRSNIPVVSAVGHETDFTISDFVADLRAPTPSAAAELVVPLKNELQRRCMEVSSDLRSTFYRHVEHLRRQLTTLSTRLVDPKKRLQDLRLKTDDCLDRMMRAFQHLLKSKHEHLAWRSQRLSANSPINTAKKNQVMLEQMYNNLIIFIKNYINEKRKTHDALSGKLHALSPRSVLDRGYSITLSLPDETIVRESEMVDLGQNIRVLLSKGLIRCRIEGKN